MDYLRQTFADFRNWDFPFKVHPLFTPSSKCFDGLALSLLFNQVICFRLNIIGYLCGVYISFFVLKINFFMNYGYGNILILSSDLYKNYKLN